MRQKMKIVFYDIETSGLMPDKHDIIQIAAIAFSIESGEWNELEEFRGMEEYPDDIPRSRILFPPQ